jgi:hypothetical protein
MNYCLPLLVVFASLLTAGCSRGGTLAATGDDVRPAEDETTASAAPLSPPAFQPAEILRNMPMNSDFRCLGIALVAEAMLDGKLIEGDGCEEADELGRRIYQGAEKKAVLQFRPRLCLEEGAVPIQSREALDKLSTVVADLYKQRHLALLATSEGRRKIVAAQSANVKTTQELDAILDADRDKIHAFLAIGLRQFPDASEKPTYHVVLIAKTPTGKKMVYDPNDPGAAIQCQLEETNEGLFVQWTCKYRDTGQITTQEYQIVSQETFFRIALAEAN